MRVTMFYPGWLVHAGLFCCAAVVVGSSGYVFGMFVVPVTEEFGLSRANINNGFIALLLGVAIISPIVGRLLDRFSARLVIFSGALAYSFGLITLSYSNSGLIMLLVILGPVAYGYAACGTLAVNTVIVRWFKRRRGTALGIMAVSTSSGGFVFAPFTAMIIENFSWRSALLVNGSIVIVAISLASLLLIRNRPHRTEAGYNREFNVEDDSSSDDRPEESEDEKTWSYAELLRNRNFWLLTMSIGLLLGSDQAMVTSKMPFFLDIGIELQAGAFIISCMTISAVCGKLLVGYLADRVDLRFVFYFVALFHIALLVVLVMQPSYWVLLFFSTVFGVGIGGVFPVWSTLLAWLFGTKNYGTVMGLMTIVVKGMSVVVVRFIGEVYDVTGSYIPAFLTFMVGVSISIILASLLRPQSTMEPAGVEKQRMANVVKQT